MGEAVIFSLIEFQSKAQPNRVNAGVINDPGRVGMRDSKKVLFDTAGTICGGFNGWVDAAYET